MTDPNVVNIDADEMGVHQIHLAALTDRITTAWDAARTTLSPDAFGTFGEDLATECIKSQQEGAKTLQIALDASNAHHDDVAAWLRDLETNEQHSAAKFRSIGVDDD